MRPHEELRVLCPTARALYDLQISQSNFGEQMLRDAPIRAKLIAIFILPALGTVILASLRIAGDLRDGSGARRGKLAVALAVDATTLAHELGGERDLSAVWQSRALPQPSDRAAVTSARSRVDRAMGTFRASAAKSDTGGQDQGPRGLVRTALTGLGRLPALRDGIDHGPRTPATVRQAISAYTATTGALLEVAARMPGPAAGSGAARELGALVVLAQAEEAASFQRGLGAVVTRSGGFQGRDQQLLAAAMGARQDELAHFLATATPGQRDRYQRAVGAPRVEHADELEALLLGAGRNPTGQVSPNDWLLAATERVDALRAVAGWLGTQAVAANRAAIASASGRQLANALVLLVAVLSSVALASFLARSMVRPLLLLEQAAMDVAEQKLPGVVDRLHRGEPVDLDAETQPIDVAAASEIGRVAAAFTAVQRVAFSVAIDQAALRRSVSEMFVNMARRSQSLVDRQLALIDDLERHEADAVRLEQFFKLDHLATRMRRNAESLIVLSGSEPGHRWTEPDPLASLLRAAVSEIEDYTRVRVLPVGAISVAGHAGVDVAHLLAELIENAAWFSPPHTAVLVAGELVPSGYLIEIEDRGIGMSDAELLAGNERLGNPPLARDPGWSQHERGRPGGRAGVRWVATYTQHLPAEIGQRRRAEVASDVWEQRAAGLQAATPAAVVALSILRRIAAGMPADLRWRQGQLAAARGRSLEPRERPLLRALASNWWLVLAGLIGAAEVVVGARIALGGAQPVIGTGATARTGTTTGGGILIASAGLLVLLGIVWRRRSRSGGGVLIAAGALPAMPLWPWLVPLVVVLAITSELVRARHLGRPGTPPPSGYQVALTLGVQVLALWLAYLILIGRLPLAAAAGLPLLGLLLVTIRLLRRRHAA